MTATTITARTMRVEVDIMNSFAAAWRPSRCRRQ
jgi:hypothetical protein